MFVAGICSCTYLGCFSLLRKSLTVKTVPAPSNEARIPQNRFVFAALLVRWVTAVHLDHCKLPWLCTILHWKLYRAGATQKWQWRIIGMEGHEPNPWSVPSGHAWYCTIVYCIFINNYGDCICKDSSVLVSCCIECLDILAMCKERSRYCTVCMDTMTLS